MADPLGSLEKIVKLALRIKEAVDTVRHNKEECQQIRTRAVRISSILSGLPETGMTADDPATRAALEDLEESLRRAHALVAACQESATVCLYCTAGRQARRLRRVQDDISLKMMLVVFATNIQTTIILTNFRVGVGHVVPPTASVVMGAPIAPPDASRWRMASLDANGNKPHSVLCSADPPTVGMPLSPLPKGAFCSIQRQGAGPSAVIGKAELTRAGIRIGGKAVEHSPFTLDSPGSVTTFSLRPGYSIPVPSPQGLRKFSLSELEAATHHFSAENLVASGAFATVYKGILHDGLVVAIKKFQNPYVLSAERIDELHLVSKLKHKNIVKLIGYGSEVLGSSEQFEDTKVGAKEDKNKETYYSVVEEYMPKGSLDKIINGLQLDWSSCFLLIQGIAQGLCYLHRQNVVHLDVKPSNIVLDSDLNPKITDFGIARVLNQNGVHISSDVGTVAGTLGYMPPEYITDGTLSKKHDVYGFGVTLLETISCVSRFGRASGQASIEWAWKVRQSGAMMMELLYRSPPPQQLKEIHRYVEVGLLCTQFDPADRPDMADALEMLCGDRALRTPVRPGYTTKEPEGSWCGGWSCLRLRL